MLLNYYYLNTLHHYYLIALQLPRGSLSKREIEFLWGERPLWPSATRGPARLG
jgi:hypothetical protein